MSISLTFSLTGNVFLNWQNMEKIRQEISSSFNAKLVVTSCNCKLTPNRMQPGYLWDLVISLT